MNPRPTHSTRLPGAFLKKTNFQPYLLQVWSDENVCLFSLDENGEICNMASGPIEDALEWALREKYPNARVHLNQDETCRCLTRWQFNRWSHLVKTANLKKSNFQRRMARFLISYIIPEGFVEVNDDNEYEATPKALSIDAISDNESKKS